MVEERLKEAIKMIREDLKRENELEYEGIGLTSLLYCPLKTEYKKRYPDLRNESITIDDGFLLERTFTPYLSRVFQGKVHAEPSITAVIKGHTITGHPDFVIEDKEITILEFKAPIMSFAKKQVEIPETDLFVDTQDVFSVSETYILQARIQKRLAREFYKKPVNAYLFIKTTVDINKKKQKLYILKPIHEEATDEEIETLVKNFHENKRPRYEWECSYCPFRKVCEMP